VHDDLLAAPREGRVAELADGSDAVGVVLTYDFQARLADARPVLPRPAVGDERPDALA
jgi:hypothetical protein